MQSRAVESFDSALTQLLAEADQRLEARYGHTLRRHPARPPEGAGARPQYAGLFTVVANFSAGIGSQFGPGYTLTIRAATLEAVSPEQQRTWEAETVAFLRARLPEVFPGRALALDRDTLGWKLHGDLSLSPPRA